MGRVHCITLHSHLVVVLASVTEVGLVSATLPAAIGSRGGGMASRAQGRGVSLRA
jgi:hypothetical protein